MQKLAMLCTGHFLFTPPTASRVRPDVFSPSAALSPPVAFIAQALAGVLWGGKECKQNF